MIYSTIKVVLNSCNLGLNHEILPKHFENKKLNLITIYSIYKWKRLQSQQLEVHKKRKREDSL